MPTQVYFEFLLAAISVGVPLYAILSTASAVLGLYFFVFNIHRTHLDTVQLGTSVVY